MQSTLSYIYILNNKLHHTLVFRAISASALATMIVPKLVAGHCVVTIKFKIQVAPLRMPIMGYRSRVSLSRRVVSRGSLW